MGIEMGYVYSDSEMMMATQIAYLDFDNSQNRSVGDVVNEIIMKYGMLDSSGNPVYGDDGNIMLKDTYANAGNSKVLTKQLQVVSNIKKLGDGTNGLSGWEDWKVVDVCNDQTDTGYYGMLIDTGDGNAIIGCRGSESYNLQQIINDWVVADVGLLNNDLTTQQARSEKYMEELWYQYGDKYDSFSVTGHSLGGNLAEHMTITAPAAMRSRIDHAVSFDGPGFSKEYIDAHREDIAKASDRISRYQWSWVASLLLPLPGVKDTIIKAHDDENVFVSFTDSHMNPGGELLSVIMSRIKAMFFRHDTHNVEFDENGSVMAGDESALAAVLGPVSIYIELFDDFIESFEDLYLYGPDDTMQIPLDIIKALVNKTSNPQAYEEKVWRNMIFTACAVLNKQYMDQGSTQKGNKGIGWTLDENNRSFQFGRLIAAMEKAEQDYYYQSGDSGGDKKTRMTTAIKALNSFRQKPFSTYARVQEHLTQAYIPRLNQPARIRYEKLKGEIMGRIADYPKEDLNKPLEDIYLLGYDLQRNAFFIKASGESKGEGETEKP